MYHLYLPFNPQVSQEQLEGKGTEAASAEKGKEAASAEKRKEAAGAENAPYEDEYDADAFLYPLLD